MSIVRFFHRFGFLRQLAKAFAKKIYLKQKFHSGYIFFNAVDHSWAWTGEMRYNTFDADLQNYIHQASFKYDHFVDVGCNIGVMTIGTLLKNNRINALAIDANKDAINLLKKSLRYNKLSNRCQVLNAVFGNTDGFMKFDGAGSVIGHVSETGVETPSRSLAGILNTYSG